MTRQCPNGCNVGSKVTDTRETTTTITRRRECRKCKFRWTTWERIDSLNTWDGQRRQIKGIILHMRSLIIMMEDMVSESQQLRQGRTKLKTVKRAPSGFVETERKLDGDVTV